MILLLLIIHKLLTLITYALLANIILSYLLEYDIISPKNVLFGGFYHLTEALLHPILAPFRRKVPHMGAQDPSRWIVLLLVQVLNSYILPQLIVFVQSLPG